MHTPNALHKTNLLSKLGRLLFEGLSPLSPSQTANPYSARPSSKAGDAFIRAAVLGKWMGIHQEVDVSERVEEIASLQSISVNLMVRTDHWVRHSGKETCLR